MANTRQYDFESVLRAGGLSRQVEQWLHDDCPTFDVGGFVVGNKQEEAFCWGKSSGILAGSPFFTAVFEHLGCTVEVSAHTLMLAHLGCLIATHIPLLLLFFVR